LDVARVILVNGASAQHDEDECTVFPFVHPVGNQLSLKDLLPIR